MINTGPNIMPPLSDFEVTFTDHKKLPDMQWDVWHRRENYPEYDIVDQLSYPHYIVMRDCKKPKDVNVVMNSYDKGRYIIIWAKGE